MSKYLISILSNRFDILSASHLINSIAKENPHTEISVLTYKNNEKVLSTLSNVSNTFCIDQTFIQNINEGALYSDSFGLNSMYEAIEKCIETQWDKVINFSNDDASSYLCSMFQANHKVGTTISSLGSPVTSNQWSNYFNFVTPNMDFDTISKNTIRHNMLGIPFYKEGVKVKVNEEYSTVAAQNFSKIRQTKEATNNANIVAISLAPSYQNKFIDMDSLIETIETLESSDNYRAVLILSGTKREKEIANELNHKFDNALISISAELLATSSVLQNVDFLITTNNDHLMIADGIDTKIIEVRPEVEQRPNSAIVNPGNFVIFQKENTSISNDIILILNEEFETELPITSMNSQNAIYAHIEDDYGLLMTQIRGEINIQKELRYHIERCYHFQLMGYAPNKDLMNHIKAHTDKEALKSFVTKTKDELTNTVKILLATLRSLKGVKQSKSNLHNFISYLDTLIQKSRTDSITRGPVALFEGDVEGIETTSIEENMKSIEKFLFKLKNDLQLLTNILSDLVSAEESSEDNEHKSKVSSIEV